MDRAAGGIRSPQAVMRRQVSCVLLAGSLLGGCGVGRNYLETEGPRYGGAPPDTTTPQLHDTLRIVSFNIEFAYNVDSAISVLKAEPSLQSADILLLQEMDGEATARI